MASSHEVKEKDATKVHLAALKRGEALPLVPSVCVLPRTASLMCCFLLQITSVNQD